MNNLITEFRALQNKDMEKFLCTLEVLQDIKDTINENAAINAHLLERIARDIAAKTSIRD